MYNEGELNKVKTKTTTTTFTTSSNRLSPKYLYVSILDTSIYIKQTLNIFQNDRYIEKVWFFICIVFVNHNAPMYLSMFLQRNSIIYIYLYMNILKSNPIASGNLSPHQIVRISHLFQKLIID